MARLLSFSLFTRLYLTIAMAMVTCGAAAVYFIDKVHVQGFINDHVGFADNIEEIAFLFAVIITVVGAIYCSVKIIQRQIENLVEIQQQFAAGEMNVRARETFTKPLNDLALSFNFMAKSISDTVTKNQIFYQALPHEVRTPLSRIQLAVGLLHQNNENSQHKILLDNIDTYICDINLLIEQVVLFTKLDAGIEEPEMSLYQIINLSAFIKANIKAIKCEKTLKVICHLDSSLSIKTNPTYLRLLFDNLLKNALIHGNKKLMINLYSSEGHIVLSVGDDGDGIPTQDIDSIFMPFSRLDMSRSRQTGGLGLGLAIAKAASKRMNCKISVENSIASGAKFICQFS